MCMSVYDASISCPKRTLFESGAPSLLVQTFDDVKSFSIFTNSNYCKNQNIEMFREVPWQISSTTKTPITVPPAMRDSDIMFCLQLISKILIKLMRIYRSLVKLCINHMLQIGLIHT